MPEYVKGLNPAVLQWARETSSIPLDEVAKRMHKDPAEIEDWEIGAASPTYVQLESLAYKIYKRPLAIFFFPEPPQEETPSDAFRTLPDTELDELTADTRYALRQARAMQLTIQSLAAGEEHERRRIFADLPLSPTSDVVHSATAIREYLGIPLERQLECKTVREALGLWRDAVEHSGVFVFKRAMKQKGVSGFCLLDSQYPIIYINNSTALSRQIFTILHELTHILLNTNGLTLADNSYIQQLDGTSRQIEILCNQLAAEILLPETVFVKHLKKGNVSVEWVSNIAQLFCVSREVVLRRLLDRGIVSSTEYEILTSEWTSAFEDSRSSGGGNYYANQATYLSNEFVRLAFRGLYRGERSIEDLSQYFGMRAGNVPKLEQYLQEHGGLV